MRKQPAELEVSDASVLADAIAKFEALVSAETAHRAAAGAVFALFDDDSELLIVLRKVLGESPF